MRVKPSQLLRAQSTAASQVMTLSLMAPWPSLGQPLGAICASKLPAGQAEPLLGLHRSLNCPSPLSFLPGTAVDLRALRPELTLANPCLGLASGELKLQMNPRFWLSLPNCHLTT